MWLKTRFSSSLPSAPWKALLNSSWLSCPSSSLSRSLMSFCSVAVMVPTSSDDQSKVTATNSLKSRVSLWSTSACRNSASGSDSRSVREPRGSASSHWAASSVSGGSAGAASRSFSTAALNSSRVTWPFCSSWMSLKTPMQAWKWSRWSLRDTAFSSMAWALPFTAFSRSLCRDSELMGLPRMLNHSCLRTSAADGRSALSFVSMLRRRFSPCAERLSKCSLIWTGSSVTALPRLLKTSSSMSLRVQGL
mmetsp:Transcript_104576/g.295855  ORF Transcript_104576/g.295855 Transcript_104576/m.295855 type:complete len:249 (+) Transcript_104576:688-1434(+)